MGLSQEKNFPKYHRVLSLSKWSARKAACILLGQLLSCFVPCGPVVLGIDETLERRWGQKIAARGIYRDNVRSSSSHFVKIGPPKRQRITLDELDVSCARRLG